LLSAALLASLASLLATLLTGLLLSALTTLTTLLLATLALIGICHSLLWGNSQSSTTSTRTISSSKTVRL
jgi:hypothetical protein